MDLTNAGEIKIDLLLKGVNVSEEAKEGLGTKYQEKNYSYCLTDWTNKKEIFPSNLFLDNRVFVGFRYNKDSPWKVEGTIDSKVLTFNKKEICAVDFTPRPKYYDKLLKDNKVLQSVGLSCGNHGVSFFVNTFCEYFKNDENCKFCSLVPTQKKFNDMVKNKKSDQVSECLDKILELNCHLDFIQFSGGSFYNHDREAKFYMKYIEGVSKVLAERKLKGIMPVHLTCMPPHNDNFIKEWKKLGLDTLSYDLEFPTRTFFEKNCPGKSKSKGYDGIRNSLKKSIDIMGPGNVYTILIAGIEPQESFTYGIESLLKDGVIPTINIFHNDPFNYSNMDVGIIDEEALIDSIYLIAELFKKYGAKAGKLGCAHYDIGHEIKKGYFG